MLNEAAIALPAGDITLAQCVALLEARRKIVCDEISERVGATAACDVDFNTLLAERAELVLALSHLRPLCSGEARIPHPRDDH
jgi:hypothetical protein